MVTYVAGSPPMYYGLSSDDKPVVGVKNASGFYEMDTSDIYFFDLENETWRKMIK